VTPISVGVPRRTEISLGRLVGGNMYSFFPLPESRCMVCRFVKKLGGGGLILEHTSARNAAFEEVWGESELLGRGGSVCGLLLWDPKWVDKEAALGRGQAMNAVNHPLPISPLLFPCFSILAPFIRQGDE